MTWPTTVDEPGSTGVVQGAGDGPVRPMRSDAKRNRELLIATAATAFGEHGVDTSLEDIARQAGVGIGTLYRHFPTRADLVEAVYRQNVEVLCGGIEELLATRSPDAALAEWMERFIRYVAIKRGLIEVIKSAVSADSEVFAYTHGLITDSITVLVDAAAAAGTIKPDVEPDDVLRGLSGFCLISDHDGWQEQAVRLVEILMDGLRYGCSGQPA